MSCHEVETGYDDYREAAEAKAAALPAERRSAEGDEMPCRVRSEQYFICTLPAGHDLATHVAHGPLGEPVEEWPA